MKPRPATHRTHKKNVILIDAVTRQLPWVWTVVHSTVHGTKQGGHVQGWTYLTTAAKAAAVLN